MGDLTLAEFLAARLGEDEAASREVHEARVCSGCSDGWEAGFDPDRCDCGYPARVLREAGAGRKRLALMAEATAEMDRLIADDHAGRSDQAMAVGRARAATVAVKYDAEVYDSHPDYREEWRP